MTAGARVGAALLIVASTASLPAPAAEVPAPETAGLETAVTRLIEQARTAVMRQPDSAEAWGRLGAACHVHGFNDEAEFGYRRAIELAPDEFRWVYFLARVSETNGEAATEFIALYERAAELRPEYAPVFVRLGLARSRVGRVDGARAALERAVELAPALPIARRSLGEILLADGDPAGAVVHLQAAAELSPSDAAVHSALARAWDALGEIDLARSAADRAAGQREAAGTPDPIFERHVLALGASSRHRFERARALVDQGQYAAAITELEAVAAERPDDPDVRYLLGVARDRSGRVDLAMPLFVQAVRLKPDHVRARIEVARILEGRGRLDDAIAQYRRCREISPRDPAVLVRLATALADRGDMRGLVDVYLDLAALRPDDARVRLNLAIAHIRLGELAAAIERLEEALEIDPGFADAQFGLGVVYEQLGRGDEALERFTQALRLDPGHEGARQRLADAGKLPDLDDPGAVRREFEEIARRLFDSDNTYLGRTRAAALRERLAVPNLDAVQEIDIRLDLTLRLLETGEVDDAVAEVERAVELTPEGDPSLEARVQFTRGLAYMRQAEIQNCVARHNADCCILPFRGGGVHTRKEPASNAKHSFERVLAIQPTNLAARWLLNVMAMALGDYPDSVGEGFRLPPESFESAYDIGRFRDIATELGVDTFNSCGGAIVEDFDGDGLLDIVTSTFDPAGPLTFYRNDGRGGFEDRSEASGASSQLGGLNTIAGDYDNDGDADVLVLRGAWLFDDGRIRNSLLRNDGDGIFTDVTRRAGMADPAYPTQVATWGDFDNDGDLDLYVCNESRKFLASRADYPSQLFRNNGDGTFTDVAPQAGVTNDRYCKGVAAGDFDNDGDVDLYTSNIQDNRLYRNRGDGTFDDVAREAGVVEPSGRSFAPWFFDYDNDGWLDLFVAGYRASIADLAAQSLGLRHSAELPRLYRNRGNGTFENVTRAVGLDRVYLPMGANFGDLDNDGWLDVYLATGDPYYESLMPNVMLRNDGGKRFQDVTQSGGFGHLQKGHGVAFADLDNDGDQDLYHQLGGFYAGDAFHNALFENPGHGNRWIVIRLVGVETNRAAYGARIEIVVETSEGERTIHRAVGSVSSFGGSPNRQEIGLGNASRIVSVTVTWPKSGTRQIFRDVSTDGMIRITEGSDELETVEMPRLTLGGKSPGE